MGESLAGSESITIVIVFAVLGSVLGSFIEVILDNFSIPIPYTVLVFYVGVIIGFGVQEAGVNTGEFFTLSTLSSDLILYGFLPTLLFSEAMTLNMHHLTQFFNQAAVLAGPGAVIICMMLAVLAKGILPWAWPWEYAFLFGAILCATDPVSVVSLLKSTRASSKLTMIVAGESLLNDGSAIILYLFFAKIVEGVTFDAPTLIGFILEMLLLSPLLGCAFGFVTARIMRRLTSAVSLNMDVQIVLSFICAYASFFVAAYTLEISGVLCCCSAGLMISLFAPIRVVEDEKYHLMWHRAEWLCNTLIFLLAGFIGGSKASTSVNPESILYLLIFYVLLLGTRLLMTFMLFPLLNWVGTEKVSVNEGLFATYAGLRGALGIALALDAANNASADDDSDINDIGQQIFFLVTGLASLTLLINGSTAGMVLVRLKLIDDPKAPISPQLEQVLLRIKLFMHKLLRDELDTMKTELGEYDELQLFQLCSLVNVNILPQLLGKRVYKRNRFLSLHSFFSTDREQRPMSFDIGHLSSMDAEIPQSIFSKPRSSQSALNLGSLQSEDDLVHERLSMRASGLQDVDHDLIAFIRQTFIDVIRARYHHSLHTGKIGSGSIATRLLLYSTDVATDYVRVKLNDLETIKKFMHPNKYVLAYCQFVDDFFSYFDVYPGYVSKHDTFYERLAMYILTNYIDAHEYAQTRMHFFLGGPLTKEYNITGPEEAMVMNESTSLVAQCKDLLESIPADDLQKVYTHRAARMLTLKQMEVVQNIVNEGILSEKNAQYFFSLLQEEEDTITMEIHAHMKEMMKRNVKNKITTEKLIRERMRKQQQGDFEDPTSDGVTMSPMAAEGIEERPSFRKNLTGMDNMERLSNISSARPSLSGATPMGVNISRAPIAPIANSTSAKLSPNSSENDLITVKEDTTTTATSPSSPSTTSPPKTTSTIAASTTATAAATTTVAKPGNNRLLSEESGLDEVELDNDRK